MREFQAGAARVLVRPDGIAQVVSTDRKKQTLEDAKAIVEVLRKVAGNRRIQLLIDIRATGGLASEAQAYYNSEAQHFATAVAMVTSSTLGRVIANFIIAANHGLLPVKLFNDEPSAVEWLAQHPRR